jgi:aminopeptidase N
MWVHEGFTAYSENLFLDYHFGKQAGADYTIGTRKGIQNDIPIIGPFDVNKNGSKDMYSKGANLLHTIRQITNNDELWRETLRGINKKFYHQTVSSRQVENFISESIGFDLKYIFNQYLRDVRIPKFEFKIDDNGLNYRWTNTIDNFNMPLDITLNGEKTRLYPGNDWKTYRTKVEDIKVDRNFYIE